MNTDPAGKPRLRWGDHDSPDSQKNSQTGRARLELIITAKCIYPEFLEKLSSDVFPLFEKRSKSGQLAKKGYDFERVLFSEDPRLLPFGLLAPENGLEAALREWAKKFHAEVDWIFVNALLTLWLWRNPEQRKDLNWTPFWFSSGPPRSSSRIVRAVARREEDAFQRQMWACGGSA